MHSFTNAKPLLCRELVGRAQQLQELGEALQRAATGKPQLLLLAGEAGMGKTKLCRAFMQASQAHRAVVLYGQAIPQDQALPFGPFLDAFRRFFTAPFTTLPSTDPAFQQSLLALSGLLPELASLWPERPLWPRESEGAEVQGQQAIFHGMLSLLQLVARSGPGPLVLLLEDLHWADETSLDLLAFLAQRLEVNTPESEASTSLLLLGTYRSEALAESAALRRVMLQLHMQRQLHEVKLAPLDVAEHRRCLQRILDQPVAEEFAGFLLAWDEGNPFFTEELLGAIAASGQLQVHSRGWLIPPGKKLQLPASLSAAILERFTRLPEVDQEVLSYAAVIGRDFDFPLLAALCGLDEQELVRVLRHAMQAQLISEVSTTSPRELARYQFRHALTREAIYEQMLVPERRLRHRKVAETLERLVSEPPQASGVSATIQRDDVARLLAEYYWQAGLPEKAGPYALQEAERARRVCAFREERYYLNMAQASLPEDSPERLHLLQRMGMLSQSIYEMAEALQWLEIAKTGYQRIGYHHQALYVMANLLLTHWQIASPSLAGMVAEVEAAAERAFAELDSTGGDVELLAALAVLAHYWTVHGLHSRCVRWLERCFALFEALDDPARVLAIQMNHMTDAWLKAHRYRSEFEEGVAETRRAIDASGEYGLPDVMMFGHTEMALMLIYWGRCDEAEHVLEEAAVHEERSGTLLPSVVLGWHYFFSGEHWDQGIERLRPQIERLDRLHTAYLAASAHVPLAHILLARNELAEAERHLQAAQPALESNNEYLYLAPFCWGLAKLQTMQGNLLQAQEEYERILKLWKTTEDRLTIFPILLDGIIFFADRGNLAKARQWLVELEEVMQLTDNPVGAAALLEARGVIKAMEGDAEEVIALLQQAVEAWSTIKWRYQGAHASQRLAELLLAWTRKRSNNRAGIQAARAKADSLLDQALAVYERLQIPMGIQAVQALRSSTRLDAQRKRRHTLEIHQPEQPLTQREMQILLQLTAGRSNREIASTLRISAGTVEQHVSHILTKLGCETRTQVVAYAFEHGWVKR